MCPSNINTDLDKLSQTLGINGTFKTSAKTGENVKSSISFLVKEIIKEGLSISKIDDWNKSYANFSCMKSSLFLTTNKPETESGGFDGVLTKRSIKLNKKYVTSSTIE